MKRTSLIATAILCVALMSCASTGTDPVDRNASNGQPGKPQATEPEEMHGHSMNATGVSTMETSVKGDSAVVTETTVVTTPAVAQVDATLVPNTSSSTATVTSNTSTDQSSSTWNTNTTSTTSSTSGNMTSSTSTDDDDDDTTATESRRRMRKD